MQVCESICTVQTCIEAQSILLQHVLHL